MVPLLAHGIDRLAIRLACRILKLDAGFEGHAPAAQAKLTAPDFFGPLLPAPARLNFSTDERFDFPSPVESPWPENNLVPGVLHLCGPEWRQRPIVILLHGWNAEFQYHGQFPGVARRLRRADASAIRLLLPYHGARKPAAADAVRNFISSDLLRGVEAVQQAVAEIRAVVAWLRSCGATRVGLWGISLGAWLAALVAGVEAQVNFAVLMSPLVRLDRAIADLPFCAPIRRSLAGQRVELSVLDPATRMALCGRDRVLVVKPEHDLFAPPETVEEFWRAWDRPEIWRLPHGHISVLFSPAVLERAVRWIAALP